MRCLVAHSFVNNFVIRETKRELRKFVTNRYTSVNSKVASAQSIKLSAAVDIKFVENLTRSGFVLVPHWIMQFSLFRFSSGSNKNVIVVFTVSRPFCLFLAFCGACVISGIRRRVNEICALL